MTPKHKKRSPSWNMLWWQACTKIAGIDRETEARCVGNAIYYGALAHKLTEDRARQEGFQAYRNAGGTLSEAPKP